MFLSIKSLAKLLGKSYSTALSFAVSKSGELVRLPSKTFVKIEGSLYYALMQKLLQENKDPKLIEKYAEQDLRSISKLL